jgi:hypothetical protein
VAVRYFAGLVLGTLVSLGVHAWVWSHSDSTSNAIPIVLCILVGGKLVASVAAMFSRQWRPVGAGLLTSMATGFLIFFGLCFANIDNMKI